MSEQCLIPHPLKREGTYQWQRLQEGLKEGFFKPDDRTTEQLVRQVCEYASYVRYYDKNLKEWGRWEAFFEFLYDYRAHKLRFENIDSLLQRSDVPAHLGLLLSFLKTFQTTRDEFNKFTGRHLDFYYNDVLRLSRKASVADKVVVLFQPEKNTIQAKVETGRELNAGKDATGKDLVYKTNGELIVNQVTIAARKTTFSEKDATGNIKALHIAKDAPVENRFTRNNISSWYPFGSLENQLADIGFAVSSPMLYAKEGRRRLSIEIEGGDLLPRASLIALYTTPKGWSEAEVDISPGINAAGTAASRRYLLIKINEALPAVAGYNEKVHKGGLACTHPVVKLLLKNNESFAAAYAFFTALKAGSIKKMVMNVEGAKSFTITGENGKMNALQAFKPFGSTPVKNKSFFTIGSTEAFNKYLKTFHLAANWKGAPGNMYKYYKEYDAFLISRKSEKIAGTHQAQNYTSFRAPLIGFDQGNVPGKVELLSGGKWVKVSEDVPNQYVSRNAGTYNTFHANGKIKDDHDATNSNDFSEASRWGFAKVTLQYDFGHHLFSQVLSDVIMQNTLVTVASAFQAIPSPPYTPEFASLHLDYVLEDTIDVSADTDHRFIQLHPFGSTFITSRQEPVISADYKDNGQLFLGLSGCDVPQIVSLYFARLDGTEDIDAAINEKAAYYYLSANSWTKFKFEEIAIDTTHGFTASGFISFSIPASALIVNSSMGENLIWIKAVSPTSAKAYPSIIDIHTNAAEAEFDDRGNDPYHLQTPLAAGSIAKPLLKIQGVKTVIQPYASYGGSISEQGEQFNTRISERLRHKNRSWSIWDYEHLLLDKFPSIYKIKTVSHAKAGNMYSPGNVLCIALPATANLAEKDLLQPRLSKGILTEATEYINRFISAFAKVTFINPFYETITVKCSVKMKAGYDENFYSKQLNKDLQQYISPWILNKNISPSFQGKIYASAIINFIEERVYIDYLTNFEASKSEKGTLIKWETFTAGSSEDVVLTSAAQHEIDTLAVC